MDNQKYFLKPRRGQHDYTAHFQKKCARDPSFRRNYENKRLLSAVNEYLFSRASRLLDGHTPSAWLVKKADSSDIPQCLLNGVDGIKIASYLPEDIKNDISAAITQLAPDIALSILLSDHDHNQKEHSDHSSLHNLLYDQNSREIVPIDHETNNFTENKHSFKEMLRKYEEQTTRKPHDFRRIELIPFQREIATNPAPFRKAFESLRDPGIQESILKIIQNIPDSHFPHDKLQDTEGMPFSSPASARDHLIERTKHRFKHAERLARAWCNAQALAPQTLLDAPLLEEQGTLLCMPSQRDKFLNSPADTNKTMNPIPNEMLDDIRSSPCNSKGRYATSIVHTTGISEPVIRVSCTANPYFDPNQEIETPEYFRTLQVNLRLPDTGKVLGTLLKILGDLPHSSSYSEASFSYEEIFDIMSSALANTEEPSHSRIESNTSNADTSGNLAPASSRPTYPPEEHGSATVQPAPTRLMDITTASSGEHRQQAAAETPRARKSRWPSFCPCR